MQIHDKRLLKLYIIMWIIAVRQNFFKQNKLGLSLLTKYKPFWLSLFC